VNREQLAHVLRAASSIVTDRRILVIGSQSILATYDEEELPVEATASVEVDLAFFDGDHEARADQVDGAIGELLTAGVDIGASSPAACLRQLREQAILLLACRAARGMQGLLDGFHRCHRLRSADDLLVTGRVA
jgi:hypothetical protein